MSYIDSEKIDKLIAVARQCNLEVDEKGLRELIGYDDDPQEADDQIGILLSNRNRNAHYHHSVAYMGEKEQTFLDLLEAALKMLDINEVECKSEYQSSTQSEDVEIRIGNEVYKHNFRYGYTSDDELLAEISKIASKHSDKQIVEIHGPDESYVLCLPPAFAEHLDQTFVYMKKI